MSKPPDSEALWTSTQVAAFFGVGVSSIKRWTDQGALESVKTMGGHRRYRLEALHEFARRRALPTNRLPALDVVINPGTASNAEVVDDLLAKLDEGNVSVAGKTISGYLQQLADPTFFMDHVLGRLLRRIGELWASGEWTVEKEHRSAYCVAEAIDKARKAEPESGPVAILACPPGEGHSLPLNMLRFLLTANGWRSDFIGGDVPWESLDAAVERVSPEAVLLTARSDVPFNSPEFGRVAERCREAGTAVCIGGSWARGGARRSPSALRFRTLAGFERWLHSRDNQET